MLANALALPNPNYKQGLWILQDFLKGRSVPNGVPFRIENKIAVGRPVRQFNHFGQLGQSCVQVRRSTHKSPPEVPIQLAASIESWDMRSQSRGSLNRRQCLFLLAQTDVSHGNSIKIGIVGSLFDSALPKVVRADRMSSLIFPHRQASRSICAFKHASPACLSFSGTVSRSRSGLRKVAFDKMPAWPASKISSWSGRE